MSDNTRSIEKINSQIMMLNKNPNDIEEDKTSDDNSTLKIKKIDDLKDHEQIHIEENDTMKINNVVEDNDSVENDNYMLFYIFIVILIIILLILLYILFK